MIKQGGVLAMLQNVWNHLVDVATTVGLRLIYALVILVVGLKLSGWFVKWVSKRKGFQKLDSSVQSFFKSFLGIVLKVLVVISAAVVLGIPTTSFITMLASCGVAIGLALQGSLSNFAGGLIVLIFRPFKVGDYIDAQGYSGTVKSISIFYTTLLTVDNQTVTLPNGTLTNNAVVNVTGEPKRRVDLEFSVGYQSDMNLVKDILLTAAKEHELTHKDPAPFARLTRKEDSALVFQLRVWCDTAMYWDVYFDLNETIKAKLDENGIIIPYPQVDVHIQQ